MKNTRQRYGKYWLDKRTEAPFKHEKTSSPNEILESVERLLGNANRLLDVGCGDGSLIEIARSRFDEVYGCGL